MARYARRRKSVRPFRAMRKARAYRSRGLGYYGRRVGRYIGSKAVHWFRKELEPIMFNESGSNIHSLFYFQASTLPEWTQLKNTYDQYLVKKITLMFEPQYQGSSTNATAPYQRWMRVVHDYDDSNALTTEQEYLNYGNCKSYLTCDDKVHRVVIYPKIKTSTENYPSGTVLSKVTKPGWLDTTAEDVQHRGVKFMIPTLQLTSGYTVMRMRVSVVIGFKNSR